MRHSIFRVFPLFGLLILTACGGGSSSPSSPSSPGPPAQDTGGTVAAGFFGMTIGGINGAPTLFSPASSYPPENAVTIGAIGHPPELAWETIEPTPGVFDFTLYDQYVNWANSNGIPFMMTFAWTPNWASVNCPATGICTVAPDNMSDWQAFVQAVVSHYDGIHAPTIKYYELWNEADSNAFWTGTYAQLAQMAQIAYPIIHQSPGSILLAPSVTGGLTTAVNWLQAYLQQNGGAKYADGGTFHGYLADPTGASPYPFPEDDSTLYEDIVSRTNAFRSAFDSDGLQGKPMFDTEGSWGPGNVTDPTQQAAWLARWYILQAGTGLVSGSYWFTWGNSNSSGTQWGLISNSDGTPTEAGIAYGQLYGWLAGATISPCNSSNSVYTCSLTRSGGYQGQIVWLYSTGETSTASYTPASQFTQSQDLMGNVTAISSGASVQIGPVPILLETGNP